MTFHVLVLGFDGPKMGEGEMKDTSEATTNLPTDIFSDPLIAAALQLREDLRVQITAEVHKQLENEFQNEIRLLRNEFEERMETATAKWLEERESLIHDNEELRRLCNMERLQAAVAEAEAAIAQIQKEIQDMLDDPNAELSGLIQKNARKTDLESYLRGLRYRANT